MIDLTKIYTEVTSWIAVTVIGGMVTWIVTLYRKVNTNEKQLKQDREFYNKHFEILTAAQDYRDILRIEDRDRMERVEEDVRESRRDIQEIKNALIRKIT
jgi:hypothetical protein